jgi:hypothetical protein
LSLVPDRSLSALLAEAITQVTDDHRDTCDVADPISPSATVAILRLSDGLVEYLVLGEVVLVLDTAAGAPLVLSDPREAIISQSYRSAIEAAAEGSEEYHRVLRELRANRNQPGGFWVAKDDPRAADEAITGSCRISELTSAVLLSRSVGRRLRSFGAVLAAGFDRIARGHRTAGGLGRPPRLCRVVCPPALAAPRPLAYPGQLHRAPARKLPRGTAAQGVTP